MREGQRAGVVLPRVVVERVIAQFERFAAQGVDDSPYYGPIRKLPADISAADRERLTRAYAAAVEERLRPAFRRVHAYLAPRVSAIGPGLGGLVGAARRGGVLRRS